ncbi:hypothetical protein M409DRAFT_29699 [Zasmidium cellare ATCC 36951]|uniref:Uncharacterized protein n=1 Tax=Zasmidium cellare ATCC 36951 TaxID=1080233 RepID=A0A6A6C2E4_ZASCE|nr:uncharacterized protein M409DRAFT_29699 [Zasmidium cellare ATCC 36951]KAF2159889.1 hypothetical protein M409DRAFT_29699 [Zasmidium cellare ATCC 36951]
MKIFYDEIVVDPSLHQPGCTRLYRIRDDGARENKAYVEQNGWVQGGSDEPVAFWRRFLVVVRAVQIEDEFFGETENEVINSSGHWVAEENPEGFAAKVLEFIGKEGDGGE